MIELAQEERPKRIPYTTSSGLQIGSRYEPPRLNTHTREDDFWQAVLLGDPPYMTRRQAFHLTAHIVVVLVLVALAIYFGG